MTAMATATSQAVTEWGRIFPKEVTESRTSSTTFMKQLTVVAVSTITYLKNTFPEDSYMVEQFAGIKLRILKKKCRDELAQFLSTSLIQAFEAIDKKYLHQMALCFYDKECNLENLMEYYIFEYLYNDAGVTMNMHSKTRDTSTSTKYSFENVRERTVHLIRACVVIMESCQNLPDSYEVGLRLYYNDTAPTEYQAPGYLPVEGPDHIAPLAPHAVKLGWVATPFHRLTASAYMREHVPASHEPQASQNPPILNDTNASDDQTAVSGSDAQLMCSCRKFDTADELLTCQYCNTHQHAACYGVLSGAARTHCCVHCSDADPARVPTDTKLASLVDKKREALCIFRRTLMWCSSLGAGGVSGAALAGALQLSGNNAARLLRLLRSSGVLPSTADSDSFDTPQQIQPAGLKSVMNKYFQTGDDTVERLATESAASESMDPLGDVLSPLERVNLQETVARVIDNPEYDKFFLDIRASSDRPNVPEMLSGDTVPGADSQDMNVDPTLTEYREAIMGPAEESRRGLKISKRKADPVPRAEVRPKRAKAANKKM